MHELSAALEQKNVGIRLFKQFLPWWTGGTDLTTDLFLPPQPAAAILRTVEEPSSLVLLHEGKVTHQVSLDSLKVEIGDAIHVSNVNLEVSTVTDTLAYLTVFQRSGTHDELIGTAELDLHTVRLGKIVVLNTVDVKGNDMFTIPNDHLVVIPGQVPAYILLTRSRIHFLAFQLWPNRPAKLLTEQSFLFDSLLNENNINSEVLGNFDPILREARFVPPKYLVARYTNDSIYLLDVETWKTATIFSPGNFMRVAVNSDGLLAFFTNHGRKIYAIQSTSIL